MQEKLVIAMVTKGGTKMYCAPIVGPKF